MVKIANSRAVRSLVGAFNREEGKADFVRCPAASATVRTICLTFIAKSEKEGGVYAFKGYKVVVSRETCRLEEYFFCGWAKEGV